MKVEEEKCTLLLSDQSVCTRQTGAHTLFCLYHFFLDEPSRKDSDKSDFRKGSENKVIASLFFRVEIIPRGAPDFYFSDDTFENMK